MQSGKVLWTKKYNSPDIGPNGVTVANGTVFGATEDSAFALQASTGKQIWIKKLTRNGNEGIDMAPGYHDGTVYVSTVPGNASTFYAGNGQAILWALNASNGAKRVEVGRGSDEPVVLGAHRTSTPVAASGIRRRSTVKAISISASRTPRPFPGTAKYPWGSSRPGPDLYTDSIVKLDPQTGKLMWYYQLTPHDIYDWDMENSPILATANGQQLVIDGGKAGILVAVNAQTGKLVWKRPVGVHNGHDNDHLFAEHGQTSKLHTPEVVEPGDLGGIESQLASNGTTVFAAVNNLPVTYTGPAIADLKPAVVQHRDRRCWSRSTRPPARWSGTHKLPSSPYGAVTLANNVGFTTTFNGTLYAFNAATGDRTLAHRVDRPRPTRRSRSSATPCSPQQASRAPARQGLIIAYRLGAHGTLPAATTKPPAARQRNGPSSQRRGADLDQDDPGPWPRTRQRARTHALPVRPRQPSEGHLRGLLRRGMAAGLPAKRQEGNRLRAGQAIAARK